MLSQDIINAPTFRLLGALLRHMNSAAWRKKHPIAAGGQTSIAWQKLFATSGGRIGSSSSEADAAVTNMLTVTNAMQADPALWGLLSTDDVDWIVEHVGSKDRRLLLNMLGVLIYTEADLITADEAAEISGHSAVNWRTRAAAGSVPGAVKKSNTWLFPRPIVEAMTRRDGYRTQESES